MFAISIEHEYIDNDNEESQYTVRIVGPNIDTSRKFNLIDKATQFVKEHLVCYLIDSGKY